MVVKTPSQMAAEEQKRYAEAQKLKEERENSIHQTIDNCFASSELRGNVTSKGGTVMYNTDSKDLLPDEDIRVIADYFFQRGWSANYVPGRSLYGENAKHGTHIFVIEPLGDRK
ncbi:hypothetical protein HY484_04400 [Candidatus Woesearchaeota archaeon]|nr:hypothetical protein [Candidatus Woesearchaeota archaeon]